MNISEVVEILEGIKNEHGDVPVWHIHDWAEVITEVRYVEGHTQDFGRKESFPGRVEIAGT